MKYVCIENNSGQFQVTMMCRLLDVSRSGFMPGVADRKVNGTYATVVWL
ncbi:MAG: hypothetical protein GY780_02265 [bacterium]|nr:hypothetical protein [bacterium]